MGQRLTLGIVTVLSLLLFVGPVTAETPSQAIAGEDCKIDIAEIQSAISHWAHSTPVGDTGETIGLATVQVLIQKWAADERISNCTSSVRISPTVTVTRVVDGDTVEIEDQNGTADTVRLIGVDTPEVHTATNPGEFNGIPDTPTGHDWLSRWGENASAYTERVVNGTSVQLRYDPIRDRRGSFGRLLAYLQVNDSYVLNRALVKNGFGRVYTESNFTSKSTYMKLEAAAQSNQTGVWGFTNETSSGNNGSIAIAEIHEDAQGDERDNLNDEYIVLENTVKNNLNISGWTIRDTADHVYTVPTGITLGAGEQITLHTGSGTDSETDLYWDSENPVWNNGGDTVIVRDGSGTERARKSYDG